MVSSANLMMLLSVLDTVICVQGVEQRTRYTALWRANIEVEGCGEMGAKSASLYTAGEEVSDPAAGGGSEYYIQQFFWN